ncbi:sensor histidine kinase, partial [Pseudonocardia pini]|uniref:sensor histidine kinase n=1 Tax=Pseudonocardia pini TaxID=2758030 RepID=UPI0015F04341
GRGLRVTVTGGPAPVLGDPALLERVAGNLVENAVRHNVDGGWVEVSTAPGELRISSSGTPVDAEAVDELFEPFRRGPVPRTGVAPGSGLGLSIVRAVVAAHGGEVRADPVPGGGLTVTVHLPTRSMEA